MNHHTACSAALAALLLLSTANAQEWTRFRGPNGTGESETPIPAEWSDGSYRFKVELPGAGHSSPVLWGQKLFLTCAIDKGAVRLLLCLDASTGQELWRKDLPSATHHVHEQNSFASSTPAVDADRVYLALATPEQYSIQAFDHDGHPAWQADLGPFAAEHGFGTSPIVLDDLVVVNNDQDQESFLVALDRHTGEVRWKTPRKTVFVAYSTPCVYEPAGGKRQLIFNSQAHGISSLDPATGDVNWELAVFDKRSVSSPLVVAGLVFGSCGSGGGGNYLVAVRPGDSSGPPEVAWKFDKSAPYVPTSVAQRELLFCFGDNGVAACLHAPTGKAAWQGQRIGGNFSGSPVRAGERIFCANADGDVIVIAATDRYRLLARNSLGETCRSTPAIANGNMYLRTQSHLYCVAGENAR